MNLASSALGLRGMNGSFVDEQCSQLPFDAINWLQTATSIGNQAFITAKCCDTPDATDSFA